MGRAWLRDNTRLPHSTCLICKSTKHADVVVAVHAEVDAEPVPGVPLFVGNSIVIALGALLLNLVVLIMSCHGLKEGHEISQRTMGQRDV
jgi:hypothetical protein